MTRVLFQGNTAIGVEFKSGSINLDVLKKKKSQVVFASKEVILCGGAINTPWLLMLSGFYFLFIFFLSDDYFYF